MVTFNCISRKYCEWGKSRMELENMTTDKFQIYAFMSNCALNFSTSFVLSKLRLSFLSLDSNEMSSLIWEHLFSCGWRTTWRFSVIIDFQKNEFTHASAHHLPQGPCIRMRGSSSPSLSKPCCPIAWIDSTHILSRNIGVCGSHSLFERHEISLLGLSLGLL